jgi:hypothetical protein
MGGGGRALLAILAAGLSVLAMCTFVTAGGTGKANAQTQTCTTPLQAVALSNNGTGPAGDPVVFEGQKQPTDKQVVVPLKPVGLQATAQWTPTQIRNANTITNVARTRAMPPRGALIAVATAIQESSLNNVRGGDRDSAGLFQQRPSQGWGTAAQLTDPVYAATQFYDALLQVSGWQTKPLAQVAQAVQRSATPGAYARWEQTAGALVAKTWGVHVVTSLTIGCDSGNTTDPAAAFTIANPRSPAQAIAAARAQAGVSGWYRRCDNFVAQVYGYFSSGSATADVHWNRLVDAGVAHPGDGAPPPGALLFYDTHDVGHVAIYLGNDLVASNDVLDTHKGEGKIAVVHRNELTSGHWKLRYRGWAQPSFPGAGGTSTIPVPETVK